MKALVIGMGSVGKRHFENLKSLGLKVDGVDINERYTYDYDLAVVSTPTDSHFDIIQDLGAMKIPFLVEKPVVEAMNELELLELLDFNFPHMVACNLRFTSAIDFAKTIAKQGVISFHSNISDSNPSRSKYGNIVLQDIHEFDYLAYLFGKIADIEVHFNTDESLYDALVTFESGLQGTIHGDKLSNSYVRECNLQTMEHMVRVPIDVSNQMYEREIEYFVKCVKQNTMPMNNLKEALSVTRKLLEAIDRSHYSSKAHVL